MSENEDLPPQTRKFIGFGRPPKYDSPEEMQAKIEEYFNNCPDKQTFILKDGIKFEAPVITISGLVLYLGFCDRSSFYKYEEKEDFRHTIKRARTFIEMEYERILRSGSPTGAIFALKNFGWVDKSEMDLNAKVQKMPTIMKNGKKAVFNVGEPLEEKPDDE